MAQSILNGVLVGGIYATVALGLSVVFGVLGLVNLAHGELVIGGGYLAYLVVAHLGLDPLLALAVVAPAIAAGAYPLQRFLLTGLLRRSGEAALVATFGLSLIAQGLFAQGFSTNVMTLAAPYASTGVDVLGVRTRVIYLIAFGIGVALVGAAHVLVTRTRTGVVVRAAAENPTSAGLLGIDIERVYALTFAAAAAAAAVAGVLVGVAFSFTPVSGLNWLLIGFVVVVLGGVGSITGTLAGAVALGVTQSVTTQLIGSGYRDFVVYALFLVALVFRPSGLARQRVAT